MNFWAVVFIAVLVCICFPFIRMAYKRVILWIKLKTVCRKCGFKLFGTYFFWPFGLNSSEKCDFYIETSEKIFAVKLFSVLYRRSVLVFCDDGEYFTRSYGMTFLPFLATKIKIPEGKRRSLPDYRFRYKYRDEWEIKSPRRVLLINPVSGEMHRLDEAGKESVFGLRESVNGMELFNLTYFVTMLEGLTDVDTEAY